MRNLKWGAGRVIGAGILAAGFSLYTSLAFAAIPLPSPTNESPAVTLVVIEEVEELSQTGMESALDRGLLDDALTEGSATRDTYFELYQAEMWLGSTGRLRELDSALASAQALLSSSSVTHEEALQAAERIDAAVGEVQSYFEQRSRLRSMIQKQVAPGIVGVYASDLHSGEVIVSVNPDLEFTSASLYKLFVAYSMLHAVEEGEWSWSDPLLGSWSLERCFDEMIIYSDNDCPVAWLEQVGVKRVNSEIQGLGLENSQVVWSDMVTTAADMGHFLELMFLGDLVGDSSLERLSEAMEKQYFRDGIPADLEGVTVLNKVGFLEDLLHDAGVVRSKNGDIVLVILTSGSSWETIAEVASTIYQSV